MDYSIHPLTLNELPTICAIVHRGIREDFTMYDEKIRQIYIRRFGRRFYRQLIAKKGNVVLGGFVGDELVGVLGIKGDFGGAAFLDWLIVKRKFRSRGIGTALLSAGEKWALENKYHYLYFYTETRKNIDFYKKKGYEFIGTFRKSWYGSDEYAMQKVLRDKPFPEIYKKHKTH